MDSSIEEVSQSEQSSGKAYPIDDVPPKTVPPKTEFMPHLHGMRGLSILAIMGAHAWSFAIFWSGGLTSDNLKWLFYFTETLFHGSTLFFALISGILFSLVLNKKVEDKQSWRLFFQGKLTNVLMPYLVLSIAFTGLMWQFTVEQAAAQGVTVVFYEETVKNIVMGQAQIHFWYIPVLLVLFLMTPLLNYLDNKNNIILWVVACLPLFVSRSTFPNFIEPQTFVYFLGAYALGIRLGRSYDQLFSWIESYKKWLWISLLVSSTLIMVLYWYEYKPWGVFSFWQTMVYVQKIAAFLLILSALKLLETKLPKWLGTLGTYSFAIYFLHVNFMAFVLMPLLPTLTEFRPAWFVLGVGSLNMLAGVIGTLIFAWLIKLIFRRHSRKLVGV